MELRKVYIGEDNVYLNRNLAFDVMEHKGIELPDNMLRFFNFEAYGSQLKTEVALHYEEDDVYLLVDENNEIAPYPKATVEINDVYITGVAFLFDGSHKFYILDNTKELIETLNEYKDGHWVIKPMKELKSYFNGTPEGMRFIQSYNRDITYIDQ